MKALGVYQFFKARSEGNRLEILVNDQWKSWTLPRQAQAEGLCLADLVNPLDAAEDYLGIFVTTAAGKIRAQADEWKNSGEYLKSHILQALALETAEASAEFLHSTLRSLWGFPDSPDMSMMERFQARYRGKRYSFGYPACPKLDDQKLLFEILKPEDIGVELTEGFMMSPESSVSALVFSHPNATYFGVGSS